jgi:hypothetical protein
VRRCSDDDGDDDDDDDDDEDDTDMRTGSTSRGTGDVSDAMHKHTLPRRSHTSISSV